MTEAFDAVNGLRAAAGLLVLLYASYTDLVARRVKNEVWVATAAFGVVLLGVDALIGEWRWVWWLGALGVVVLAYGLWYVRLLYGGADAKALMALALLLPYAPSVHGSAWGLPVGPAYLPMALSALTNGVAIVALLPLLFAAYNLARGDVAVPAMFVGRRMALQDAVNSPVWVMETVDAEGRVRRRAFPRRDVDPAENAARLLERGVTQVWVTPKVPFMIPLTVGYLLALGAGDLVFQAMAALLDLSP